MKQLLDYIVENYGVDRNSASSILLTLFTFLIGLFLTWLTSIIVKFIKRREYRKCLKLVIADFIKKCKRQHDINLTFFDQKGILQGENYSYSTVSNYGFKYLESLNVTDFTTNFLSVIKKKNAKRILKLFEIVEYIRVQKEQSQLMRSELFERFKNADTIYSTNLDALRKYHDDLVVKYKGESMEQNHESDFVIGIINIYNRWYKNGQNREIENTYNEIALEILNFSKKIKPNPMNRITIDYALECKLAYENMIHLDKLLRNDMQGSVWAYKKAYKLGDIILKGL